VTDATVLSETEHWLVHRGLPYFVDSRRERAHRALSRQRLVPIGGLALAISTAAGIVLGWLLSDVSYGVTITLASFGLLVLAYSVAFLEAGPMARWAVLRTFSSLDHLLTLVTRALPLLLLFVTFLFINTEVWQVASSLDGGVLWAAVMMFVALAVGFLLSRLPEELDKSDDLMSGRVLVESCVGTPVEHASHGFADHDLRELAQVNGLERVNLILVLLVSQVLQVFLLSLAVFGFFVTFGVVAIKEPVLDAWLLDPPHWVISDLLSVELLQVGVFLAAFSGLYFTVYAVSDENYRRQFFTKRLRELDRAVGVRAVYRMLRAHAD
jgi:hypothetical protein